MRASPISPQSLKAAFAAILLVASVAHAEEFLWGVANSAFQVEGHPEDSDWRSWTRTPGRIGDGTNADVAADFWNHPERDLDLAKKLGAKAFRISLAWERIETAPGWWNDAVLDRYKKIFDLIEARGMEPIVTLQHFALPTWLVKKGGLLAPDFPRCFAAYALKVAQKLYTGRDHPHYLITFNEPMVMVHQGYLKGEWPPGEKAQSKHAIEAVAHLARAHIAAVKAIRDFEATKVNAAHRLRISIAKHWRHFERASGFWNAIPRWLSDWVFNHQLVSALQTGKLVFWMPGSKLIRERVALPDGRSTLDFLGINYYGRFLTKLTPHSPFVDVLEGPGPKSDLGWEIYPEGLYLTLKDVWDRYRLPVLISENGLADASDQQRGKFIEDHVSAMKRAQKEGVPVIGYLHWSLTDNFEWALGLKPRFGLVEVNYKTQERKPRPSFEVYRKIIERN